MSDEIVLDVRGVTKVFPGVIANEDVSFTLRRGEIHCLLGENGAGKSTLMNVVFGLYKADEGEVLLRGQPIEFSSSRDAINAGIGMVHQHFKLIPVFTVAENVVLGSETTKGPFFDVDQARRRILDLGDRYGLKVDPDAYVGDLSVGEQQRVELVKALYREADLLILDEPTAVLTPGEVDEFFGVVRSLVSQGKSVIFITHKLREVLAVADRITVLRGGKVSGTADPKTATQASLATLMVGKEVTLQIEKTDAQPAGPVLEVRDLSVHDDRGLVAIDAVSLTVRAGEIYGVAGVQGNGQRELVEALAGMRKIDQGSVAILGTDTTRASPRTIHDLGVAHVPEDREHHGSVSEYPIYDNLVLNTYRQAPYAVRGVRQIEPVRKLASRLVEMFDVRPRRIDAAIGTLSGGNRQKVIVARELSSDPKLLLVAQPTRGLDVGSIEFIHNQIIRLRDEGAAVLLVSAELDEIMSLSDRIGVLYHGRIVGETERADATRERLGLLMARGADQAEPDETRTGEQSLLEPAHRAGPAEPEPSNGPTSVGNSNG